MIGTCVWLHPVRGMPKVLKLVLQCISASISSSDITTVLACMSHDCALLLCELSLHLHSFMSLWKTRPAVHHRCQVHMRSRSWFHRVCGKLP